MSTPTPSQLLSRALWVAFQASSPMGLGYLHVESASKATETDLAEMYADDISRGTIYTDYVFGRMVKTTFSIVDGELVIASPSAPREDYQSWVRVYKTNRDLIETVYQTFGNER